MVNRNPELLNEFSEFLREHGYPEDAIVLNWRISSQYVVDLAVIDPETDTPVALIETKRDPTTGSLNLAGQQLATFSEELGDDNISLYVVFPSTRENERFRMYRYVPATDEGEEASYELELVPSFELLRGSYKTRKGAELRRQRKSNLANFQVICFALAFASAVLLVLDFNKVLRVTPQRLILIGISCTFLILPYAGKLNFLGWEFQRLKEQ